QEQHDHVRRRQRASDERVREHPEITHGIRRVRLQISDCRFQIFRSTASSCNLHSAICSRMNIVQYTALMPADISARVIANTRLSSDYNVLALAAPEIAAAARPGQFVMVKAATSYDPLLRRPFSVFEVLRDETGSAVGISLLNKRIGVSTGLIYGAREGDTVACLGPLGRPFSLVDPPTDAWMVAGGVGLAPFAA